MRRRPSLRPSHLATDLATTIDAVIHLIDDAKVEDGYILLLQPTSPLRTASDLEALFQLSEATPEAGAIVSVVQHNSPHPNKIVTIGGGYVKSYLGTNPSVPRQSLPVVHSINGAFYIVPRQVVVEQRTFLLSALWLSRCPGTERQFGQPYRFASVGGAFETTSARSKPLLSRLVGNARNASQGLETSRTCERPRTYRGQ